MNISEIQLVANRENAQHSTGPRTPEGKKRSSLNATRHGLTGQVIVMPYEDLKAYSGFVERYVSGLDPKNEPEKQLAVDMANNTWKLNRCTSIESGIYAMGHCDNADHNITDHPQVHAALTAATTYLENSRQLENLSRQENRLRRTLQQSTKLYHDLQDRRRERESREIGHALPIAKAHKMQDLPYDPAADGYVLSNTQLEQRINRDSHWQDADIARHVDYNLERYRARTAA